MIKFYVQAIQAFFRRMLALALKNTLTTVGVFMTTAWLLLAFAVYRVEHLAQNANITTYWEGIWWGIVTFLTVGYGDRYPITPEGRLFGGILMFCGVIVMGIVTAKISSFFLEQTLKEGRGLMDSSRLKNHFIICGWKEEMHELISHVLDFNPDLAASQVVLIAPLSQQQIDEIHANIRLKDVAVIPGDYFSEVNLKRAAPERARKIMILADRTPNPNGQMPSLTEVDARTIMTAMTLSNIARGVMIAAEVLDPKMDHYLKLANVSEIVYSREYSRLLLGNVSGGTGVANIIFDLLDPKTSAHLTTMHLSDALVKKTYSEMKQELEKSRERVVIGVLENSGNQHTIKENALKKAQKTTDMKKLLENLQSVKHLRCNQPVFNPSDDYIVGEGAMAIIIETGISSSRGK